MRKVPRLVVILRLIALGLFSGAMLLIALSLLPYWNSLSPEAYRESFRAIGPHIGTTMVPLMFTSIGICAFFTLFARRHGFAAWLPLLLLVAIVPLYGLVHAPANSALLGLDALTSDALSALRHRWNAWHWVRTCAGLVALAFAAFTVRQTRS